MRGQFGGLARIFYDAEGKISISRYGGGRGRVRGKRRRRGGRRGKGRGERGGGDGT